MKAASRFSVSALLVFALALIMMPAAKAGVWNHETKVTFNNSVQLPGTVLPPGDYRFQLLESPSNRHIVQVFNAEHSHVFGTFFTVPVYRMEPAEKTTFVMEERPYGQPEAIKEWYYPGETVGDEFIYSRDDSSRFVTAGLSTPASADVVTPTEATPTVEPAVAETVQAPSTNSDDAAATTPATESVASQPVEPEASQEPKTTAPEKQATQQESKSTEPAKAEELPKTASNLYFFALLGSLSVLTGVAIRRFAKS